MLKLLPPRPGSLKIVVATPLRLIDLIKSDEISLDDIQIVTLDEADRMADDGFTPQVEWILRHCTIRNQTMLFSATLDGDVGHLIRAYQTNPETVAVDEATDDEATDDGDGEDTDDDTRGDDE